MTLVSTHILLRKLSHSTSAVYPSGHSEDTLLFPNGIERDLFGSFREHFQDGLTCFDFPFVEGEMNMGFLR